MAEKLRLGRQSTIQRVPTIPALAFAVASRLAEIPGVTAVALGGSHARGVALPDSDLDIGLYYDAALPFDLERLQALCRDLDDAGAAEATPLGGWGPWVNGGAWLTIQGLRVDFIYRDLGRVASSVEDALAGRVLLHAQVGHPHGIHAHHYAAEVGLGIPLHDPAGRLAQLKQRLGAYPDALREAMLTHYRWQPGFWLDGAAKGLERNDLHWAMGCSYQAVMAMVQALCADQRVWLTNEKQAVAAAGRVQGAPRDFENRVREALARMDLEALKQLTAECWPS